MKQLPLPDGALGGAASAINNRGEIIGWYAFNGRPGMHAMLWSPANGFMDIHPPGMAGHSQAVAINEKGQILINVSSAEFEGSVLWTPGGESVVIDYQPSRYGVVGRGLNDRGDVTGYRIDYAELVAPMDAITWSSRDGIRVLPSSAAQGYSRAMAIDINNFGKAVGVDGWVEPGGVAQPVPTFWEENRRERVAADVEPGKCSKAPLDPIFDRILCGSWALAINDAGQIAGSIGMRAFVSTPGEKTAFIDADFAEATGMEMTVAGGINNRGDVIGMAISGIRARAFVWYASGFTELLPTLGSRSESRATGINDRGQVVGFAQ
ncbi:MAG TPA: hypothetical protein VHM24_12765 [Gemmatimonadaceae bacterium]|nr:hypothetical protein [Gemmatimonadaceae bacterium]